MIAIEFNIFCPLEHHISLSSGDGKSQRESFRTHPTIDNSEQARDSTQERCIGADTGRTSQEEAGGCIPCRSSKTWRTLMRWRPGTDMAEAPLFFDTPSVISSNVRRLPAGESSRAGYYYSQKCIFAPFSSSSFLLSSSSPVVGKSFFICNSRLGASGGGGDYGMGAPPPPFVSWRLWRRQSLSEEDEEEARMTYYFSPHQLATSLPHPTPVLEKKTENRTHLSPDLEFKE